MPSRPPRSEQGSPPPSKRIKRDAVGPIEEVFAEGLLQGAPNLHASYIKAWPYKHVVIDKLFRGDLLEQVKDECITHLSFTQKETDIYKVFQTGDLASLEYISASQLELLPSLLKLRNALYSLPFRNFLRDVTKCGALSAKKQDMAVNSYTKTCHLLNHDDVIGSRRVSYILYMPLPLDEPWRPEWGGSLELYPVKINENGIPEPEPKPCKIIPPAWGQFVMFEVQPGKSFHSVEEVVVDKSRQRLSISGWFHKAQEGEEGFEEEDTVMDQERSSLEQLITATTALYPYPTEPPIPGTPLTDADISFLSKYINPVYLSPKTLTALAPRFEVESSLELHCFLQSEIATKLLQGLQERDSLDDLGDRRKKRIPSHDAGLDEHWYVKGPPHKFRYCILGPTPEKPSKNLECDNVMRDILEVLFPSSAFRAWLSLVASLIPMGYAIEARRFRPGLDYTLATSEEKEARLDLVLGLTPTAEKQDTSEWENGGWGGWECYMAPHEGDEDPTVYKSNKTKQEKDDVKDAEDGGDEDEDDSGTLLTVQPGFNRLLLVLRDEAVMHFVKYVSASAGGSRWDICAEFEVGMVAGEEED